MAISAVMFRLLCLFCVFGVTFGQPTNFNDLLDQLLDVLRPKIIDEGKDQLKVDNINYNWSYNVLFFKVSGNLACSKGKVRYLSTIRRTGDATGEIVGDGIDVKASVGLEIMQFLFDRCSLAVRNVLTVTESLAGSAGENSLTMKLHFSGNTARIDSISVTHLADIELTTGTNIIHQLENRILNGLVNKFHDSILKSINKQLQQFNGKVIKIPFTKKWIRNLG